MTGTLRRCSILGVHVTAEPFSEVLGAIEATLQRPVREAVCVCPLDAHCLVEARKDSLLRRFFNRDAIPVADGMPLVRAARMLGFPRAERATGRDLMWQVLERTAGTDTRHFFYGGKPGVADALARRAMEAFPGARVAGTFCPPFRPLNPAEEQHVADRINASGADVVWVGLSAPRQERWAAALRSRLQVKLVFTVGAAFDYHTGALAAAPPWMRSASLEWLYRVAQEPRRLGWRYLEVVPTFLVLLASQLLGLRRFDDGPEDR